MKKNFLILSDLDSTLEENELGKNEFIEFENFVLNFERTFNCNIVIHIVSGTTLSDFARRIYYFKEKYFEIYKRIDYSIIADGEKYSKNLNHIGVCYKFDKYYDKADAVDDILNHYNKSEILGICYLGDSKEDITAHGMMNFFKNSFPFGSYALSPRSRTDHIHQSGFIDIYSNKPRIIGCVECLKIMENKILDKLNQRYDFISFD